MNILDIVGPVMVGPSSSHTAGGGAGSVRTVGKAFWGERGREMQKIGAARLFFWATGRGHGTDRAIVAGLLGLAKWTTHGFRKVPQKQKRQGFRFPLKESAL